MFNTTFPAMDEMIRIRTMPEFIHQDCVELIGCGRAPKHNFTVKPLSILSMGFISTFLPTSLSTSLMWKIKKKRLCKKWMKLGRYFFPQVSTSWCALWVCLCEPQGSFVFLSFYEGLFPEGSHKAYFMKAYFLILKKFYMPPFERFSFWVLTHFLEVICPRYAPENMKLEKHSIKSQKQILLLVLPFMKKFEFWGYFKIDL